MKTVLKMFTSVKKRSKTIAFIASGILLCSIFLFAGNRYLDPDFGRSFGNKASTAQAKLNRMQPLFEACSVICTASPRFMQAIVFPELMRYNSLRDGIEAESLRTLYVQFGEEYANFSIGIFQMKPGFARLVEEMAGTYLSSSVCRELQLGYGNGDEQLLRMERVERLQDQDWQMVYLTAFICICNEIYKDKKFISELEKVQWYACLYNAGFEKSESYISKKIREENFYLQEKMPGKKFRYAAIAGWYYNL
ncbi:MAG: hypothetical protein EOO45_17295 [Flavobacterium sp.]|nr:MAG: hypothetical protein EOO45_17295 [Flavobacterium sp.]